MTETLYFLTLTRTEQFDNNDDKELQGDYFSGVWMIMIPALFFNSLIYKLQTIIMTLSPYRRLRCLWRLSEAA